MIRILAAVVIVAALTASPALACNSASDAVANLGTLSADAMEAGGTVQQQAVISDKLGIALMRASAANLRRDDAAACQAAEQADREIRPMLPRRR